MYKYLLFDLDGTLTDSAEGITKCVQYALRAYGVEEPDLNKLTPFIGPPLVDAFMEYYGFDQEKAYGASMKYRERFSTVGLFENKVYEDIPQVLESLQEGRRRGERVLVIASSKPEKYVCKIMEHFGILHYFDEVVGATMDGRLSGKAEVIGEVFRRLAMTEEMKRETLMIGDRKYDAEGAAAMGIDCLGVGYGFAAPGELEKAGAKYIVQTVPELGEMLGKI